MRARTMMELVEDGMARAPGAKPAVVSADGALTYEELIHGARGIAAGLAEHGVGRGSRVGVWMDKTPAAVQALLGVLWSGAAYVPLDPRSPWQRSRRIALDGDLAGIIVDAARLDVLPAFLEDLSPRVLLVDGARESAAAAAGGHPYELLEEVRTWAAGDLPVAGAEDLAYVLYTSGSTGTPKGVVHTHASGGAFVEWVLRTFRTGPNDVFSSHAPFHFDLSISDLFAALASGATVRLLSPTEGMLATHLVRNLDEWGITVWYSVPSVLVSMLQAGLEATPPRKLRVLFFAGEVFPSPHLRRLRHALPHVGLYNLFGPTETNVCTYYEVPPELPESLTAPIPIGRICEHLEGFVIDDEGREVREVGVEGTLWIRGGNLMSGYWGDPERTRATLMEDPRGKGGIACCTGDRVRLLPDGNFEFRGRRDHMVKTRGYRVELGEIEASLVEHPAILEAVAVPIPDPALGNRIVASVVLRESQSVDPSILRTHLVGRLPGYMVPEAIELRVQLPRTSNGKVDRQTLRVEWERRIT